ncbi:MAG: hypothetical protein AAFY02_10250 [Pseudomonadota bacterium]
MELNEPALLADGIKPLHSFAAEVRTGLNSNLLAFCLRPLADYDSVPALANRLNVLGIKSKADFASYQAGLAALVAKEIEAIPPGVTQLILSGETLANIRPREIRAIRRLFIPHCDEFLIVYYVRRQDHYVRSKYSTDLRNSRLKDFGIHFLGHQGWHRGQYDVLIARWADEFGADAIRPRIFSSEDLYQGDVVADFFKLLGSSAVGKVGASTRINVAASAVAQCWHLAFLEAVKETPLAKPSNPLNQRFRRILEKTFEGPAFAPTQAEARDLLESFAESNERLRQRWFPEREAVFSSDVSAYSETRSLDGYLSRENRQRLIESLQTKLKNEPEARNKLVSVIESL